jgi:hypothetical protein
MAGLVHPLEGTSASYLLQPGPIPEDINLDPPFIYNLAKRRVHLPPSIRKNSYTSREALIAENDQLRKEIKHLSTSNDHLHTTIQKHEAQLSIQYMYARSMKRSQLSAAKPPRQTLMEGQAQILTDDAFVGRVEAAKQKSQAKQKRAHAAACEQEWKRVKAAHTAAMDAWRKAQKNPHLNCPEKPEKLKLKAVIIAEFEERMGWSIEVGEGNPQEGMEEASMSQEDFQSALDMIPDQPDEEGSEYNPDA